MRNLVFLALTLGSTAALHGATDSYLLWAGARWGASLVGSSSAKATIWGETADPDRDGLPNLLEYAVDTDPTRFNPVSDCYQFDVPAAGAPNLRFPQMHAWLRTDDPDLRVACQTSSDLVTWFPDAPTDFSGPPPANPFVFSQETGNHLRGLRQMHYIDMQSLAVRSAAFMRLSVSRRGSTVTSPGVDPFSFTSQPGVATGSTARSSVIVLSGFAGNVTLNIPAGVTLFVNGIAQTGSTATVKAGDTLWMQATAPGIAGVPRNYTLTIGGQSATWTFTTAAIAAVPDHPGTDSGYTPVETGVSDTGAAQISIPIVVSPGTAGMQPKLSINYSSQGGNGPLGVGFSLSGLSTISRVGRTVAQDGVKGGVNFDANDRFALDGQRLIAISGADGADGTEYRLEFDPTSRIRSYGTEGNGPQRWVVETKAGLKMEFGLNANSRLTASQANTTDYLRNDIYTGITGSSVTDLLNSPNYPNSPSKTQYLPSATNAYTGDNFGQRLRGYLVPKQSGLTHFTIISDDGSQLRFNPNGPSEAGATVVATSTGLGGTTPQYNLTAGTPYFIEVLHKESTGSEYFTVYWTAPGVASGTILSGDVLTSQLPGTTAPPPEVLSWALEAITDTAGNRMDFDYDDVARQRGELLLTKIEYTSNTAAGLTPSQEVVLEYEDRPDARTNYVMGLETKSLKRLAALESRAKDNGGVVRVIRRYELGYKLSAMSEASLLTVVREIDSVTTRTTPVEWMDGPLPSYTGTFVNFPSGFTLWHYLYTQVGDFNGDGKSDLFSQGDDGKLSVMLRKATPDFEFVRSTPANGFNRGLMWLGDFNGDGLSDVLTRPNGSTQIVTYRSTGSGLFSSTVFNQPIAWDTGQIALGDFNGDGRTDFVTGVGTTQWRTFLSNGDGTFVSVVENTTWSWNGSTLLVGDFNGDGLTDLLSHNGIGSQYYWTIKLSDGDGTFTEQFAYYPTTFGNGHGGVPPVAGDFNGDGIFDVMGVSGQYLTVFLLDGKGGVKPVVSDVGISGFGWRGDAVGNFNADRMTDMLSWYNYSGQRDIVRFIATGDGRMRMQRELNNIAWDPNNTFYVGDFEGDGKADVVSFYFGFSHFISSAPAEDLVAKVTTGHGGETRFSYKPLTDSSVYTKGTGAAYPCAELQASMYAVASITSRNGIDGDGFNPPPVSPVGENTVSYSYEGAWSCLDGRGFMGFKAVETTDATSGIITRTVYESSTPLLGGRTKHTEQRLSTAPVGGSALISESDTTWNVTTTTNAGHPNTYFVTEASSTSKSYEVNRPAGTALVKTATRNGFSYDGYGNLLTSTTTTTGTEIFTETVTNTYADVPTPPQWFLGRLETSSVTKTAPNPAGGGNISLTRASSFAYHPTTGLLTQEVIEPNEADLRQQKDYLHDSFGNILRSTIITTVGSRITRTTYTPDGRFVATTTNAAGHTESKTYDPLLGNVIEQTGPNGLTTHWFYDSIGRPIREERPDGTMTRSFYRRVSGSTVGAPPRAVHYVRVQSSGGAPKTVWYDLLDREIRADGIAFDGRTVSSHKVFNSRGEVAYASQPYFSGDAPLYSQMLYDAVGREYQQTDPGNRVTKTTYDGLTTTVERNYNPAALTDFQKAVTVVNAMGWTVQSSQYLDTVAKTITRKYDPYGNLRFVTDPANNTTELRYDVRGNKTWMSEPNSGASTFEYNGFGELLYQTNAMGEKVGLGYDTLGRMTVRYDFKEETATLWFYDGGPGAIGHLVRVRTIVNGSTAPDPVEQWFYYDHLSRPISTVEKHYYHSFAVSRSYDGYGRPDAITYPTGLATRQVYTANGHLSEVQNAATTQLYWRALAVNARGQITQEVQGNGVVTERAFDADSGLIDGITSTFGAAGDVQKAEFDFDLIGNLTERRDKRYSTTFSETFGYDTLNRLQTVTTTGAAAVTAAYNDLGNITSRTDVGSFSYGAASTGPHALTGVTGGAFNKSCGYDAKGNRITDGATSLTYSSFNKPVRMVKGGDTLRFDYGPDRALYRQTTFLTQPGGATSQTVREYIGSLYERETTSEGLVRHIHYIAGGSGVAAILTDERSAASPPVRLRYIHKDHLGSVDVITDSAGAVVERQSFDAWGRRRTVAYNTGTATWSVTYPATPGSAETHRGFTGHEMLDAVGLVHMGGRIYDPITARFLSPDPFVQSPDNLQNLNRYSYVLNNPLSFTDPSGFFFKSIAKLFQKIAKPLSFAVKALYFVPGMQGVAFALDVGLSFGSAFSGTLLAGGSVGDALRAGLKAGVVTYASASALNGLSQARGWSGADFAGYSGQQFAQKLAEKTIAHGVIGGTSEVLSGGKFTHGFMSAAAAAAASPLIYEGTHGLPLGDAIGTVAAATVGGTVSQIGGGKFANGAMSGAMGYLQNALSDDMNDQGKAVKSGKEGFDALSYADDLDSHLTGTNKTWFFRKLALFKEAPIVKSLMIHYEAIEFLNDPSIAQASDVVPIMGYWKGVAEFAGTGIHSAIHAAAPETTESSILWFSKTKAGRAIEWSGQRLRSPTPTR